VESSQASCSQHCRQDLIDGKRWPQHYATATIARLVEAANTVHETRDRTTLLRVVNG
jgi:hypothetical protein